VLELVLVRAKVAPTTENTQLRYKVLETRHPTSELSTVNWAIPSPVWRSPFTTAENSHEMGAKKLQKALEVVSPPENLRV
jgi:hypothetical protein